MAMLKLLERMGRADLTVHGFRSTFRDWAAERTNFPNEVVEMALAHVVENRSEAACRRGDLFDKRQRLMEAWAEWRTLPPLFRFRGSPDFRGIFEVAHMAPRRGKDAVGLKRKRPKKPSTAESGQSVSVGPEWRVAREWLGEPARYFNEEETLRLPDSVAPMIAEVTGVRNLTIEEFRSRLNEICHLVFCHWSVEELARRPIPVALIKRVAKNAQVLSRDLFRLSRYDSLFGSALLGLLPRVLLKARVNKSTGRIEVGAKKSWTFLDEYGYSRLLADLAECAKVAAGKITLGEGARRLEVGLNFEANKPLQIKRPPQKASGVRHETLLLLIALLRLLIVDQAKGRLTLWNAPAKNEPHGTLPLVLRILRPYLSEEIPEKLNYRTLHRYLQVVVRA